MMRFFLTIMIIFCANILFAQKPVIDSIAYRQWPSLEAPTISKNGKYVFYTIKNIPVSSETLVVQSTDGKWKKEFKGGTTNDGSWILSDKYFFFVTKNDSLGMLTLGTDQIQYIPNTPWCNLKESKGTEYLLYPPSSNSKDVVLKNLKTNKKSVFTDIDSWNFEDDLLILVKSLQGKAGRQSINIANLPTGKVSKIWEGDKPENLILDMKHYQLAFKRGDSVWYCKMNSDQPTCILHHNSNGFEQGLALGSLDSFSRDGKFLLTSLVEKRNIKPRKDAVEIWSYQDIKLQSEQEMDFNDQRYFAVINISDRKLLRLQQQVNEEFRFVTAKNIPDSLALVINREMAEPWSIRYKLTTSLVSIESGERKVLSFLDKIDNANFSPCGKYLIYFDRLKQDYFSYEIKTGEIRNLTNGISVSWQDLNWNDFNKTGAPRGGIVWLGNDERLLVYDTYDIWKLDPLNIEKPLNVTNGYGKKNKIIFNYTLASNVENIVGKDKKVYLTAFNTNSKNNGFFRKELDKTGDPDLLNMGPYLYESNSRYVPDGSDFPPIRAKNAETYIVRRMSTNNAPNYFSTTNFKTFTRLSDLQPQKKYNWYTTELHSWKSLDGRTLQGILYKPENFDPNKKYPVIFHYYESKSDGLNVFIKPDYISSCMNIDIPTFVSNEYLVFVPDIHYTIGDPMQGTYDAVISALAYVSKFPFVNAKKIGAQGGSFGGVQTNYLVTHTNLFAAATSSSGLSDWISSYGIQTVNGVFEDGQFRIGGSLWEKQEAYIKNSAIFQVDKVKTPLLMMHGPRDFICSYANAMEFFTGLRRMGKKVWMLVYPNEDHGLIVRDHIKDFSVRMMQFFDHYLKDKPAPVWMTRGISASRRGLDSGYEYDTEIKTPSQGLLTPVEQVKVDSLMTRKPIHITLK